MKKFLKFISVAFLAGFFAITLTGCTAEQAQNSSQNTEAKAPVVDVKTETKKEPITFQTTNENDSTLASGQTKVKQEGKDGQKEITFKVTYIDGTETAREKVLEKVVSDPVNKIILVGTKVATPNVDGNYMQPLGSNPVGATTPSSSQQENSGTGYTNIDGNHIPSPSSNPTGATAKCRDGTYSYSQHRQGTCSYHGGVAEWL